jgi:hypothetical protein
MMTLIVELTLLHQCMFILGQKYINMRFDTYGVFSRQKQNDFLTLILMLRLTLILTSNQSEPITSRKQTVLIADT